MGDKLQKSKEILKDRLHVAGVLCNKSAIYYSRLKNILLFPNLLISSVSMIFNNQNFDPEVLKYYNTCVNAITVFLIAIMNQLKISENADLFRSSSNGLLSLLHDIENAELKNEELSSEFLANSNQKYDMIMGSIPNIPSRIKSIVQSEYGGRYHLPIIINGIPKVQISSDEV
jgi:hypothetical protein